IFVFIGVLVVFFIFWVVLMKLLHTVSGWFALQESFGTETVPSGREESFSYVQIGWLSYNGVIHICFTEKGLYMDIFVLFRFGAGPVLIPWDNLIFKEKKRILWMDYVNLEAQLRNGKKIRLQFLDRIFTEYDLKKIRGYYATN
ncbi:MAG TPA: hypothetical protein PK683_20185, partial [Leptospiraceae bacterium]|nr:hypothetical protein [Leptospiraceae bacterium]